MKMARLAAAAAVISLALMAAGLAQEMPARWYGPEYQECAYQNTLGIEACIRERVTAWERRLGRAYRALLASAGTQVRRELLQEAQRLWTRYRDANCRYYREGPRSVSRIEAAECLRAMTSSRAQELERAGSP